MPPLLRQTQHLTLEMSVLSHVITTKTQIYIEEIVKREFIVRGFNVCLSKAHACVKLGSK